MSVYSQFDKELWLEGRGKAGFLAAHSSLMGHLAKEHAFGAELSVVYQTKGKKKWHKAYKYPTIGITTFFSTVGNSKVLGSYYGLFPFINLPLIKKEKFSNLSGKYIFIYEFFISDFLRKLVLYSINENF